MNRARARAETVMSRSFRSSDRIARRSKDNENVYAVTALPRPPRVSVCAARWAVGASSLNKNIPDRVATAATCML